MCLSYIWFGWYTQKILPKVGWGGLGLEKRYKGGFGHKEMSKEGGLKLSAQSVLTIEGNIWDLVKNRKKWG